MLGLLILLGLISSSLPLPRKVFKVMGRCRTVPVLDIPAIHPTRSPISGKPHKQNGYISISRLSPGSVAISTTGTGGSPLTNLPFASGDLARTPPSQSSLRVASRGTC